MKVDFSFKVLLCIQTVNSEYCGTYNDIYNTYVHIYSSVSEVFKKSKDCAHSPSRNSVKSERTDKTHILLDSTGLTLFSDITTSDVHQNKRPEILFEIIEKNAKHYILQLSSVLK